MEMNLANIWLLLIGFFLLYYAVTDGADLGVGILSLFASGEEEREAMMAAIGSTWHANQTWLVILGGMLFGAFPLFYSVVLSALYIPFILMLFGLVFRGVAFEFREHARQKSFWSFSFGIGSLITTLSQGFALGGLLGGLTIIQGRFVGTLWEWFTPYAGLAAAGVFFGYVMLGSNTLIMKTKGKLREKSFTAARFSAVATLVVSALVYFQTLLRYPGMAAKWEHFPKSPMIFLVLFTFAAFVFYFISLRKKARAQPYFWNGVIIVLSFTGLSVGLYPHMIPGGKAEAMTVQDVAASPDTLRFMLVVVGVLLPIILAYTSYSYWIFRGSAGGYEEEGEEGADAKGKRQAE
ncbi:MAG: cytochrome d ubiquinol oxidase subunit II [Deltaproteobacteria bacterium]|jgi:cytochrome d ubiquinol oxidase subunit II